MKAVTIKDIAAHVGVSNMTVSAALSEVANPHVRLSDATRQRVLRAAQELQYRPNRAARSLRSGPTHTVGVYAAPGYLNPQVAFTAQLLVGLHQGCEENLRDLLLHGTYRNHSPEEIEAEVVSGRVDGLVLYASPNDPLVERMARSHLRVVGIVDALPRIPSVVADDAGGAHLVAAYLARQGHRRVVFRATTPDFVSAARRRIAFLSAADDWGLEIFIALSAAGVWHSEYVPEDYSWLNLPPSSRPTAAVCWNDSNAYALLEYLTQVGMRAPDDLAVVGYDDIAPPSAPRRLTTVRAPWVEVARTAIALLMETLAGKEIAIETALPVTWVQGETA